MTVPSPTHRIVASFAVLAAIVVSALVALTIASPASGAAATACGDQILADWFDNGRIDRLYPLHCYEDAIDAIPDDLRDYADAEEIISRALQSALRGELAPGGEDPTPGDDDYWGTPGGPNGPGDPQAASGVDTSGLSSVPIPLLVLGGMSIVLLSAGGLGYLARRRQAAQDDVPGDDDLLA